MANTYFSDGTYTTGDGKLRVAGIGVVGTVGSTNASKAGGTSTPTTNKNTAVTTSNPTGSTSKATSNTSKTTSNTSKTTSTSTKKTSSSSGNTNNSISAYLAANGVKSDGSYLDSATGRYYTTITNADGTKQDGYIDNGVSYYRDGTPISVGASVTDSTGKTWTKGGSDSDAGLSMDAYLSKYGVSASSNPYSQVNPNTNSNITFGDVSTEKVETNPYEQLIAEQKKAYEDQQRLIEEKNKLAVEQGANRLESQKSNINQAANDNARQAYVQYMQNKKALPQQLASQGVNGGATETANLALGTTYENNLADINQNRANRIQEIDNAIVDLRNTGDLSTVEQVLANNQEALNAYTNAFNNGVGYNQWANQYNSNRADTAWEQNYQQQAYADQMAQQQLENDWYERTYNDSQKQQEVNTIVNLLENGLVDANRASTLLGIPVDQISGYVDYVKKMQNLALQAEQADINNTYSTISNRSSKSSGGGSNSSGNAKTNQTYSQVLSAIQNINTSNGDDYLENKQAAKYLLNSDLTMDNVISIMKQTNVRPEMFVKEMVNEGLSEEDVVSFIESYVPATKQDYRDSLYMYAYQK